MDMSVPPPQPSAAATPVAVETERRLATTTPVRPAPPAEEAVRDRNDRRAQAERLRQAAEPAFQDSRTRLEISFDEAIGTFVYRGLDPATGEVVREYPPEEVRERMARLRAMKGIAVDSSV